MSSALMLSLARVNFIVGIRSQANATLTTICRCFIPNCVKQTCSYWPRLSIFLCLVKCNLINRLCPLVEPILEFQDGRTRARFHDEVNIRKIVLVSTCGWWETGNFGTVLRIAEELVKDVNVEFAGAVLRPHAHLMVENTEKAKKVTEALRKVGHELIKKGRMSKSLLEVISQPLISEEEYRHRLNEAYEKVKSREED